MVKDLEWIKINYGETMVDLCEKNLPELLKTEGLVPTLLDRHFSPDKSVAQVIIDNNLTGDFKNYMLSFVDDKNNIVRKDIDKTAAEILDEAGYILYPECKTEADIQSFRHYYYREDGTPKYEGGRPEYFKDEELRTFKGDQLESSRVWFAVKKDADKLKREDFVVPFREDEYGTSVLSIQFDKYYSELSIHSRYGETVSYNNKTFGENLDNIAEGLTAAFARDYNVRDRYYEDKFNIPGYAQGEDKFYKCNHKINDVYYCTDNVIIDKYQVKKLPPHQLLVDYFVFDFKQNKVKLYDDKIEDSFSDNMLHTMTQLVRKDNLIKATTDSHGDVLIGINEDNEIVYLKNDKYYLCACDYFLSHNKALAELHLPSLRYGGWYFLRENQALEELNLPSLEILKGGSLEYNNTLKRFYAEKLERAPDDLLSENKVITEFYAPKLYTGLCDFENDRIKRFFPSMVQPTKEKRGLFGGLFGKKNIEQKDNGSKFEQ